MPESRSNNTIRASREADARVYADHEAPKIRRVLLAVFLCGPAASITVALLAGITAFLGSIVLDLFGLKPTLTSQNGGLFAGAFIALMIAAFNWFVFYIVVPVTWLVLAFSIGRFPRRGIYRHRAYYRWGVIWGALLVGLTTGFFSLTGSPLAGLGGLLTGAALGGVAGFISAALFLAIVRPKQQIGQITADVF